jgi:hypothetical protein
MTLARYMLADDRPALEGAPDLSPLLGDWLNVQPRTEYIQRITVTEDGRGGVRIRILGTGTPDPIDWGETTARPYVSGRSREAGGFHARYLLGGVETYVAANSKLGILVLQSYTSFHDNSGRPAHFGREFFRRQGGGPG